MKKGIAKFTAFCVAAGMTFGGSGIVSLADGPEMSLVGIGSLSAVKETTAAASEETEGSSQEEESAGAFGNIGAGLVSQGLGETDAADEQETIENSAEDTASEADSYEADAAAQEQETAQEVQAVPETEAVLDTSMVGTTGFAQCNEYVNIRATGDTNGEVLGKLYNNAAVYIEGVDEHGWYKVTSGNVTGYVASQYIMVGAQAEQLSQEVGYHVAEVGAEVLNVRADASQDSEIVTTVTNTQEVEVVEDCGEWLKVAVDADTYGYVSADYVYAERQYQEAESIEEEQARLDAEWLAYLEQQAQAEAEYQAYLEQQAQQNVQEPSYQEPSYEEPSYEEPSYEEPSYTDNNNSYGDAQAEADALYQEYLNAQAEADAATQQADEQLVYDTAEKAQQAYQEYLNAQAQADAQAVGGTTGQSQDYTDGTEDYVEDYTEDEYVDDTTEDDYVEDYVEDDYIEDDYVEDDYVEDGGSEDTSDSGSSYSIGQEIANYAVQFVGNPYVYGGTSLTGGADCSGFVQSVMANFGIGLPRTAASQSGGGVEVSLDALQPGDLLFYYGGSGIGHVTMYIGNNQVVHASNPSSGIIISDMSYRTPAWARRYW